MLARTLVATLVALSLLPALALAETPEEKAKALLAAKDCDQLLLSFENAKPKGEPGDLALAKVLAQAASGPCASDKIVAMALTTTAARLAPGDVDVLVAAGGASRAAGMNGEAEGAYKKAMAAAPKDVRPRIGLAELLLGEEDAAGAVKALEPVKSDPKASGLYARAQKAAKDANAEAESLRKGEEKAMEAAAKAMASGSSGSSGGGGGGSSSGGGGSGGTGELGSGAGKMVFSIGGASGGKVKARTTKLKAGRWYRLQANGSCVDMRDRLSGSGSSGVSGVDLRVRIGKFEHGLPIETGDQVDFDFQADSNNPMLEVIDSSFNKGKVTCHYMLQVYEK
ncbi:MAG: hypothetical protein QM765_16600 [Myxococcales bacterium]